ncbi:MAG: hypothetical protein KF833_16570 [Verrucomicrobiae bacterium]|nr:hypothetical protein [Verrucomicrobiae bacterium]
MDGACCWCCAGRWPLALLLVVLVPVIAILASLLLPALGRAKEKGRATVCLNQLRQPGMATLMDAEEHRGEVILDAPLQRGVTWGSLLATNTGLRPFELFVCPSYPPHRFTNWLTTYGVRLDPPEGTKRGPFRDGLPEGRGREDGGSAEQPRLVAVRMLGPAEVGGGDGLRSLFPRPRARWLRGPGGGSAPGTRVRKRGRW